MQDYESTPPASIVSMQMRKQALT